MKRLTSLIAVAAVLAACEKSPTRSGEIALVSVAPGGRTLAVGEALQLRATVRDAAGGAPTEQRLREVAWSTADRSVATVSPAGVVTGVAPGATELRAELGGVRGTVQVRVAASPPGCDRPGAVRSLAPGQAVVLEGVEASVVCLAGGEYVAVPFHGSEAGAASTALTVSFSGTQPVAPAADSPAPSRVVATEGPSADPGFHVRLRERAAPRLAPLVPTVLAGAFDAPAAETGAGPRFSLALASPREGDRVRINVNTRAGEACKSPDYRTGRVVAVGQRSVVVADTANPADGLSAAEYRSIAAAYDTLVYPVVSASFGPVGDVDGNGRVVIFYTRAVNELTSPGRGSYVAGFFYGRDLFPNRAKGNLEGCEGSNFAELLYMLAADPRGEVNGNARSKTLILETTLGTVAHELQHLINASRRLYAVKTSEWNEESWLNEAMSHLAEELVFYRASGAAARQNLARAQLQASPRAASAYNSYMLANTVRLRGFVADPERQSPYQADDDLATRGASWAFLRYALDRRGGSEASVLRSLVDSSLRGFPNLQLALGTDPRPWIRDWVVSVYADDRVAGAEAVFQQPSWNFRSLLGSDVALPVRALEGSGRTGVVLNAGSGAFFRFGVAAGEAARLEHRVGEGAPPSTVSVTVIRTR